MYAECWKLLDVIHRFVISRDNACLPLHLLLFLQLLQAVQESGTICSHPGLQVDSIFIFIHQVAVLFQHDIIFVFIRQVAPVPACWLFKTSTS